ncbi:MAG TPA: hypothetical protein VKW06_16085 [Candidatus Angelobacter sp.]|nr:hypothetical protein [Candidatus Angelobacter sp.]
MTDRAQNGMTCSQFEALLAQALDGEIVDLRPGAVAGSADELVAFPAEMRAAFVAHRQGCTDCGPLYAEAREGMLLLHALEEVEPPRNLVHNIIAVTSHVESKTAAAGAPAGSGWLERMRARLVPAFAGVLRSRFAASFCMAFFSLSLTLSLTGIKITEIAYMASHPSELRKSVVLEYTQIQARVMRYYDNMRLVYEVQNRVRELKNAAVPAQNQDKGTGQPDQQNLIRPEPKVPEWKEVVQPQTQNAYRGRWNDRSPRQITIARRASALPDLNQLSAYEIAEFMRKTEGARI